MQKTRRACFEYQVGAEHYQRFLERVFAQSGLHEDPPHPALLPLPPEMELQSRWFAGEFGDRFQSTCGREIHVRQIGHWNHSAGPDFTDAAISVDGEIRTGAIELDPDVRDWELHGHGANPAFDGVVLHIFFHQSRPRFFTRNSHHEEIIQVHLPPETYLAKSQPRLAAAEARIGRCAVPLAEMAPQRIDSLLEAAAQMRLREKAARYRQVACLHGATEALFQGLAEALGYRHNRLPMRILSQRLPLRVLRKADADVAEALLFGHSGFLDAEGFDRYTRPTRGYLRGLWDEWWRYRETGEVQMALPAWRIAGARPGNHPQRRLGVLSVLVANWREIDRAMKEGPKAVEKMLGALEHPFWSTRYTLLSDPIEKPIALVGATRVAEILANVIYPALVPETPDLWADYLQLPAKLGNEKVRRASIRLLGEREDAKSYQRKIYQQQGLLQIYRDFCLEDDSGCAECPFPKQLGEW